MPKLPIGLPVYNSEAYLGETLDAMLGQSFEDFEIIICDNASADDTEAICRRYAAVDSRIRYVHNPTNIGGIKNHNLCFKLATGTYFKWNGHDDICLPTYLEKCVAVLDNNPSIVLCQTRTRRIDADGADLIFDPQANMFMDKQGLTRIEQADANYAQSDDAITRFQKALDGICVCQHILGVMRSDVVRKTGLMGPYRDSDHAFLVEMVLHGKFAEVPEDLFTQARTSLQHVRPGVQECQGTVGRPRQSDPRHVAPQDLGTHADLLGHPALALEPERQGAVHRLRLPEGLCQATAPNGECILTSRGGTVRRRRKSPRRQD